MFECTKCKIKFESNSGGEFTNHLKTHNLTYEDYILETEYNNVKPKCKCGFCDLPPNFSRGKYKNYAIGHNKFSFQIKEYLKVNGKPKCLNCNNEIDISHKDRWPLPVFCSSHCNGKYDIENKKIKISAGLKERWKDPVYRHTITEIATINSNKPEVKEAKSKRMKKLWKDPNSSHRKMDFSRTLESREKQSINLKKTLSKPSQRARLSKNAKKLWTNSEFIKKQMSNNPFFAKYRTSNLHLKIRDKLFLEQLGFESEIVIFKYKVDELNKDKKIIIEINGDYVHGNPKLYKEDDMIILPGNQMYVKDKLRLDKVRTKILEDLGYRVLIIWESDDLELKRKELQELLTQ